MTPGAGQDQRRVVFVGGLLVDVDATADQELDGGEVAGPRCLHQWGAASLALVLQLGAVLQQQVRHVRMSVLAGEVEGSEIWMSTVLPQRGGRASAARGVERGRSAGDRASRAGSWMLDIIVMGIKKK